MLDIYPLTITVDRYNGTYSNGKYTAWNCEPCEVPTEISDGDDVCFDFWLNVDKNDIPTFGVGNSINEAVKHLQDKILDKALKEDNI